MIVFNCKLKIFSHNDSFQTVHKTPHLKLANGDAFGELEICEKIVRDKNPNETIFREVCCQNPIVSVSRDFVEF